MCDRNRPIYIPNLIICSGTLAFCGSVHQKAACCTKYPFAPVLPPVLQPCLAGAIMLGYVRIPSLCRSVCCSGRVEPRTVLHADCFFNNFNYLCQSDRCRRVSWVFRGKSGRTGNSPTCHRWMVPGCATSPLSFLNTFLTQ